MMMRAFSSILPLLLSQCLMVCLSMALTNIAIDKSALLALKSQLTINSSHILSKNWSDSSSVCSWIGVACSSRHERVTVLDISDMGLVGNLPPEIGNLTFLKSLNLSRNSFSGNLPRELARLRRLRVVDFLRNNFTGEIIPSWFRSLSELRYLRLRNNSFTGFLSISVSNLSKLEFLDLSYNPLTGKIPEEIGNLYNMKSLALQYNNFSGQIPTTIFNISNLENLALTGNNLSGHLPTEICASGNSRLSRLYLGYNELDGHIPSNISECSQLRLLSLLDNKFSGSIPGGIGNLRTLQILLLGYNFFTGSIPGEIGSLHNLDTFELEFNQFSGDIRSISNCSKLREISFQSNNFSGLVPDALGELRFLTTLDLTDNNFVSESELTFITALTNCRNLRRLGLSENLFNGTLPISVGNLSTSLPHFSIYNCDLHGIIPHEFGNLTNLMVLSMYGNQLQGSLPYTLGNMRNLQGLALNQNRISGSLPDSLCRLQNLNGILLYENQITGAIPNCIGDLKALRSVAIRKNKLNSSIPKTLWSLSDLLMLDLASNSLTGSLSPDIGNLKALTLLDLSMNQFKGNIPTSIRGLQNVINFTLAHNRFQGSIPESIGEMLNLEELDLSHNNLSGSIPKSLEALHYLVHFNASFNDLSGEIPSDGPFKNFSSQSFISNEGLCGDPTYGVPRCRNTIAHKSNRKMILRIVYALLGVASLIFFLVLAYLFVRYRRKEQVGVQENLLSGETPLRLSYYDLVRATEGFSERHLLGTGGFSSVYKVVSRKGEKLAVKVFNPQLEGAFRSFDTECEVIRNLRHRNLCKVLGTCSNEDFKGLVLEYMPNGSLEKWIYSEDHSLDFTQRTDIMIDVACALEYLHHGYSVPVVHCDIKPSNVLLDEDMVSHLSDFGVSKLLSDEVSFAQTSTFATLGYIAPEYGSEGVVSIRSDVYSYGIMLMEVFTKMKPSSEAFTGDLSLRSWVKSFMPNDITKIMDHNLLKPEEEYFTEKLECFSSIMELALNCSVENPKERINMKDVVVALKKIKFNIDAQLIRG